MYIYSYYRGRGVGPSWVRRPPDCCWRVRKGLLTHAVLSSSSMPRCDALFVSLVFFSPLAFLPAFLFSLLWRRLLSLVYRLLRAKGRGLEPPDVWPSLRQLQCLSAISAMTLNGTVVERKTFPNICTVGARGKWRESWPSGCWRILHLFYLAHIVSV